MSNKIIITGVTNAPMDMRKDGSMTVEVDLIVLGHISPFDASDIIHKHLIGMEIDTDIILNEDDYDGSTIKPIRKM